MKIPRLICNDNMEVGINWQLWGAEVDCLARLIKGKNQKITESDIADFLQGVLDRLIMETVEVTDKLALAIEAQRREGKSEDQIESYIRGWNQVGEVLVNNGDM